MARPVIFAVLAVLVCAAAVQGAWPQVLTQTVLATPGYENHSTTFSVKQNAFSTAEGSYLAMRVPVSTSSDWDKATYCIDKNHLVSLNTNYLSTWVNMADTTDLVNCFKMIGADDATASELANCDLDDPNNVIPSPTDGSVTALNAQLASTANWCDARRLIKYRGAVQYIIMNRSSFKGVNPQANSCNTALTSTHIQEAIWLIGENEQPPSGRANCVRHIAAKAMQNADFTVAAPDCESTVKSVFVIKPKTCTDANTATICNQYQMVELEFPTGPCDPIDPTGEDPECVCEEATMSCLNDGEEHFDWNGKCGCVQWIPDITPGVCTKNTVTCA